MCALQAMHLRRRKEMCIFYRYSLGERHTIVFDPDATHYYREYNGGVAVSWGQADYARRAL